MCTLTYLLSDNGYELFFNRDEQRSRLLALPPKFNKINGAIYPIDPQGDGTWIAVNKHGRSFALLNYYQAPMSNNQNIVSRGQFILSLLHTEVDIFTQLKTMDLRIYHPFQLCIFPENLSINNQKVHRVTWDGNKLCRVDAILPITSSSIDFIEVSQKRKRRFNKMIDINKPMPHQHRAFHFSTDNIGKNSVNMQREDAKTVSISHITVDNKICFEYFDNVLMKNNIITCAKEKELVFTA